MNKNINSLQGKSVLKGTLEIGIILLLISILLIYIMFVISQPLVFVILGFTGGIMLSISIGLIIGTLKDIILFFVIAWGVHWEFTCPYCKAKLKLKYVPWDKNYFNCDICGKQLLKAKKGLEAGFYYDETMMNGK